MMRDRDVLIDLINQVQDNGEKTSYGRNSIITSTITNEHLADHLLKNNVRVGVPNGQEDR